MADDFSNDATTTGIITSGSEVTGQLEVAGDSDWFAFQSGLSSSGYRFRVEVDGNDTNAGLEVTMFSPPIDVGEEPVEYARDSYFMEQITDYSSDGATARFNVAFFPDSMAYLQVSGGAGFTGGYSVFVDEIADDYASDPTTTGRIVAGGQTSGVISGNESDWFALEAVQGETYSLTVTGDGDGSTPQLTAPFAYIDGIDLATDFSTGVAQGAFTAPATGTFFLEVIPAAGQLGTYTITAELDVINDDFAAGTATTGTITVGGQATGDIETLGDVDWFAVDLDAGTYVINLDGSTVGAGTMYDPLLAGLFDDSGADTGQGRDDDGGGSLNSRSVVSVEAGRYYVAASGYRNYNTGTYTLSLREVEPDDFPASIETTGVVPVGGSVVGGIQELPGGSYYGNADRDWFSASLQPSIYRFSVEPVDEDVDPNAVWISTIYTADGASEHSFGYGGQSSIIVTAAHERSLFIEVNGGAQLAQYRLSSDLIYTRSAAELAALEATPAAPTLYANRYQQTLQTLGTAGNETIIATTSGAYLRGLAGADTLVGNQGDDILIGDDGLSLQFNPDNSAQAYRAYDLLLGREPDQRGYEGFMNSSYGGIDRILRSTEFSNHFGALDTESFVDLMYTLLRGPDGAGDDPSRAVNIAYLDRYGDSAYARAEVARKFVESDEHKNGLDGADAAFALRNEPADFSDEVYSMYHALLDRDAETKGFLRWVTEMGDGKSLTALADSVMGSAEFARLGALSDTAFAQRVLDGLSDVAPATVDVDRAVALLQGGLARADFVAGMVMLDDDAGLTNWMRAQGQDDVLIGGAGDNLLYGGLMSDKFVFHPTDGGRQKVMDLEVWDTLDLSAFGYTSAGEALAQFEQRGQNAVLVDQDVTIVLQGFAVSQLTEDMLLV